MDLLDIPYIHCYAKKEFIGTPEDQECYIFAVSVILNRPLLFTCHLASGAVFSRLPLKAFSTYPNNPNVKEAGWSALGNKAVAVQHKYLKDYTVVTKEHGKGRYLFTIDFFEGGYSEDSEQHKTANVIELEAGYYVALPNNECLFPDFHFTVKDLALPKRNTKYFISLK